MRRLWRSRTGRSPTKSLSKRDPLVRQTAPWEAQTKPKPKTDSVWKIYDGKWVPGEGHLWSEDFLKYFDWGAVKQEIQREYGPEPGATWWMQATAGVNYYRAEMPAKHLPGKTIRFETWDLKLKEVDSDTGEPVYEFPDQAGNTAVWMFPGTKAKAVLMAEMRLGGTKVLVEVDDNYLTAPPNQAVSSWVPKPDGTGTPSYQTHKRIVQKFCDGVIVSTPYLGNIYSTIHDNIHVAPNCVDPADWEAPYYGGNVELEPFVPGERLRIGWAGSASHLYDLAEIRPALDWASRQKGVEVVVLGELELPLAHWQVPWTDTLAEYRRNVFALDVILCPIRASAWANCKSDVKALEGAMGGALPVVSKTEPFRPWWDRGYVAETKKDWVKIVKHLVANRDEVAREAKSARDYVLEERTIQKGIEAWKTVLA